MRAVVSACVSIEPSLIAWSGGGASMSEPYVVKGSQGGNATADDDEGGFDRAGVLAV